MIIHTRREQLKKEMEYLISRVEKKLEECVVRFVDAEKGCVIIGNSMVGKV